MTCIEKKTRTAITIFLGFFYVCYQLSLSPLTLSQLLRSNHVEHRLQNLQILKRMSTSMNNIYLYKLSVINENKTTNFVLVNRNYLIKQIWTLPV